jgi:DNA-binding FadR family transcriptional regulator
LEVRHAIEVRAAALAAERRTTADLAAMDAIMERRRQAVLDGDGPAFIDADVDFHCAVVAAAHNPLLVELYDGLVETLRASIEHPGAADVLAAEHDAVLDAVRSGDPAVAATASADLLDHVVP